MNSITKILVFLILTLFIYQIFLIKSIYSQNLENMTCGIATSEDPELRKCCLPLDLELPAVPEKISNKAPVVADILNSLGGFIDLVKRRENIISCYIGYPSDVNSTNCICLKENEITPSPIESSRELCEKYLSGQEKNKCINECNNGVWTAIGCIKGSLNDFIKETVFSWGISLAGFISLLCIVYSAFQLQISAGNPEKIKKAQELLTSCILGLMLIIFSIFILRLIGVSILKIPGFR